MNTTSKVLIALLAASAVRSFASKSDCDAYKKAQKQISDLMMQQTDLANKGRDRAKACQGDAGCLKKLDPLREQVKSVGKKINDAREDAQKYASLCEEVANEDASTLKLFEKVASDNCKPGGDAVRCEDAEFQMADLGYRADNRANMAGRERYERDYDKWTENDKRGKEPVMPKTSYANSIKTHKRYLQDNTSGKRRDLVLYRLAFIYDMMGGSEDAFPYWMEIVRQHPDSRHVPAVNLRLGEYFFVQKKYDSAISYYNKVDANKELNVDNNVLGLSIYHRAEAYYNMSKYELALNGFFDYIERVDQGKLKRGDLRNEAILYMGSCFAESPESYKDVDKFFKKYGGRAYEDTLYFEMAKKHEDRDQFDLAINSYEYFLKKWPYFYKAPMAQIGLVRLWVKQKKIEEAQEARDVLISQYSPGAPWWSKAPAMDPKDKETLRGEIRDAMLESAVSDHFPGKEMKDTARVSKSIKSYERFIKSYESEGGWPLYRAKIYMADALDYVHRYEESADCYTWASQQDVSKYGEAKKGERGLVQPADAGYNAVAELSHAADMETEKVGKDSAEKAYKLPVCQKYVTTTDAYITRFPKAKEVDNLQYNLFLFMVNGEDFERAIPQGKRFLAQWPGHQYANDGRARLAYCYTQTGNLTAAEGEYAKVISNLKPGETKLRGEMTQNMAEVIWKRGVAYEKAGKIDSSAIQFRRIAREYSQLGMADTAALEAAAVYARSKRYNDAGNEFMSFTNSHAQSPLALKAMWSAGEQYVLAKDTAKGIATYLDYYNKFPSDTNAYNGVLIAASLYDSSDKKIEMAKTYELLHQRFPKDSRTPGYLYTAGLTYENAKNLDEALRVYKEVVALYPASNYAPEAAFSIPIIEEKQNKKKEMAQDYEAFATHYTADKSKVAKAYLRSATYYNEEEKDSKKAEAVYRKLVEFYAKGDNKVSIDASIPAEAYYHIGMIHTTEANKIKVGGEVDLHAASMKDAEKVVKQHTNAFVQSVKARNDALKPATEAFAEAIKLQIEEWSLKSTMAMADNDYKLAVDAYSSQPKATTNRLDAQLGILYRSQVGGSVPTLTARAIKAYGGLLELAYSNHIQNDQTKIASQKLLRCYLMQGQVRESIGDAIASEPCPSTAKVGSDQYNEECEYHKAQKEDKQMQFQKAAVSQGYAPGIEAAAKYGIVEPQLDSLKAKVSALDPENATLQTVVTEKKVEPKVFVDNDFKRSMERIANVSKSDMSTEEKIQTLNGITVEGKRLEVDIQAQIDALKAKLGGK